MIPKTVNLTIYQGATFKFPFYWYSDEEQAVTITSVTPSYPTLLGAPAHGIALNSVIPVAILGVDSWLNTPDTDPENRILATVVDADTLSVNVNGIGRDDYTGNDGRIVYNTPMLLGNGDWEARMQLRASIDDDTVVKELLSTANDIALNDDGEIEVTIDAADTDLLTEASVYDLELVDTSQSPVEVFRVASGKAALSKQVTRT